MKFENRLILDEDQDVTIHLAGAKVVTARTAGSFGFSTTAAETDLVELRHALDSTSEPIFISRPLFAKIREAFKALNIHRLRADKAAAQVNDTQPK